MMNCIGAGQAGGAIGDVPWRAPKQDGVRWAEEEVSSRLDYLLYEHGFISWYEKDGPHFAAASSCRRPRILPNTPEGKREETDFRLTTQLHYHVFSTRIAQYLHVVRLTSCRDVHDRAELELALNAWLATMAEPERAGRLLREGHVALLDHDPPWLAFELELHPRFRYMGAPFTLRSRGLMESHSTSFTLPVSVSE